MMFLLPVREPHPVERFLLPDAESIRLPELPVSPINGAEKTPQEPASAGFFP
jgi:hypothetical protein